eukprot:353565-Chlamydomonas_euryale.AAC.5
MGAANAGCGIGCRGGEEEAVRCDHPTLRRILLLLGACCFCLLLLLAVFAGNGPALCSGSTCVCDQPPVSAGCGGGSAGQAGLRVGWRVWAEASAPMAPVAPVAPMAPVAPVAPVRALQWPQWPQQPQWPQLPQ